MANGVVLNLKALSQKYPGFKAKADKIDDLDDLKIIDYFMEHGICVSYLESEKKFYVFNVNDDSGPVPVKGTYDDYVARLTLKKG